MEHEIEEETAIQRDQIRLDLFSLNSFRMKYEFIFTCRLNVHSSEIQQLHKEGEFSDLLALSASEVLQTSLPKTDSFRYAKHYIHKILERK